MRLRDFTEWHPALAGWIEAALFTVVPGVFMLLSGIISSGEFNSALAVVIYAFVLQMILWIFVERMWLVWLPFIIVLGGFIVSEIVYTVSLSMNLPGEGPGMFGMIFSTAVVSVLGAEAGGIVGAIFVNLIAAGVKKLCRSFRKM